MNPNTPNNSDDQNDLIRNGPLPFGNDESKNKDDMPMSAPFGESPKIEMNITPPAVGPMGDTKTTIITETSNNPDSSSPRKKPNMKLVIGALAIVGFIVAGGIVAMQSTGTFLTENRDDRSQASSSGSCVGTPPAGCQVSGYAIGGCSGRSESNCKAVSACGCSWKVDSAPAPTSGSGGGGTAPAPTSGGGGGGGTTNTCSSASQSASACRGKTIGYIPSPGFVCRASGLGKDSNNNPWCGSYSTGTGDSACVASGPRGNPPKSCCSGITRANGECAAVGENMPTTVKPSTTVTQNPSTGLGNCTAGSVFCANKSPKDDCRVNASSALDSGTCTRDQGSLTSCSCVAKSTSPAPTSVECIGNSQTTTSAAACCAKTAYQVYNGTSYSLKCGTQPAASSSCSNTSEAVGCQGGVPNTTTCFNATGLRGICTISNTTTRNCICNQGALPDLPACTQGESNRATTLSVNTNARQCKVGTTSYWECLSGYSKVGTQCLRVIDGTCNGAGTASACSGRTPDTLCNGFTRDYYCRQTGSVDGKRVCACVNTATGGPTASVTTSAGQCAGVLQSCDTTPCCGGQNLVCQGSTGNRKCQQTGTGGSGDSWCGGGGGASSGAACNMWYGFKCSKLTGGECVENPGGPFSSESQARSYAGNACGQVDQVCNSASGDRAGRLCGGFEVINNSCGGGGGTPIVTKTPTTAPVMCTAVKLWYKDGTTWKTVSFADAKTKIKVGDAVRISSTGKGRAFTKGRFRIKVGSGAYGTWQETTTKDNGEFYINYTIPSAGTFGVQAQLM